MSETQINTRLAELLGWTNIVEWNGWCGTDPSGNMDKPLPDYASDLNAMHEAEKALDLDQQEQFVTRLGAYDHDSDAAWNAAHATALQRARAFVKTMEAK